MQTEVALVDVQRAESGSQDQSSKRHQQLLLISVSSSVLTKTTVNLCPTTVLQGVARHTTSGLELAEEMWPVGQASTFTAWVN